MHLSSHKFFDEQVAWPYGKGWPQENKFCAGPPAALGHDDGPVGCGAVFPGSLRLGTPVIVAALQTNKQGVAMDSLK
jgi:hypothetical protein